ncbi:MAG TPA: hypothetical protein VLX92_15650 [Kofleriaceae bacterium]|nr:hypothetical protein [Kofleriaceae bacterium]
MRRVSVVALVATAASGCALEASGLVARDALPSSSTSAPEPPAPLPSSPPRWPGSYDGYAFAATYRLGHPDLYGYDKVEVTIAHSTGDDRREPFGDAALDPHRTTLVSILSFAGVGWLSRGWNFEIGLAPYAVSWFWRPLEETDGHGHWFSPTQADTELGLTGEVNVCHDVIGLGDWAVQLCAYTEPSVLYDGNTGISAGMRLRLAGPPMDMSQGAAAAGPDSPSCAAAPP